LAALRVLFHGAAAAALALAAGGCPVHTPTAVTLTPIDVVAAPSPLTGTAYVIAGGGALFRADPLGASGAPWTPLAPLAGSFPVAPTAQVVAADAFAPDVVYAVLYAYTQREMVLARSDDRGQTWTQLVTGLPPGPHAGAPVALAPDPRTPDRVWLAGPRPPYTFAPNVFRSDDRGATWQAASTGLPGPIASFAFDAADPNVVYAADDEQIWITQDAGGTWGVFDQGLPVSPISGFLRDVFALAADPTVAGRIYVSVRFDGDARLYVRDGAAPFRRLSAAGIDGTEHWLLALAVDPADPGRILAGSNGIWLSDDGGGSFLRVIGTALSRHLDLTTTGVVFDPAGSGRVLAATYDAVYGSDDRGVTWTRLDATGLPSFIAQE
jgi:photosystem II stability/assembly factor-like uncharacterized protein